MTTVQTNSQTNNIDYVSGNRAFQIILYSTELFEIGLKYLYTSPVIGFFL